MFGFFKKKKEDPLAAVLKLPDSEYCDYVKGVFDYLDPATRAHVLVGYQTLTIIVSVYRNEAKKRGENWTLEGFILDCSEKQVAANDEINTRRYAWFMWAAMLYRMREIATRDESKLEILGEIWCDIARAAPFLKSLLPDNVVWKPDEKIYFDLVIKEDEEDLVIWAITYGQGGVMKTKAVQRLSDEYDSIDYIAGRLMRTPERLRPQR